MKRNENEMKYILFIFTSEGNDREQIAYMQKKKKMNMGKKQDSACIAPVYV